MCPHSDLLDQGGPRLGADGPSVSAAGATVKRLTEVGIRALKQNASAVVADAASGQTITIIDRGRPVRRTGSSQTLAVLPGYSLE
jgi:hypothetical protein